MFKILYLKIVRSVQILAPLSAPALPSGQNVKKKQDRGSQSKTHQY